MQQRGATPTSRKRSRPRCDARTQRARCFKHEQKRSGQRNKVVNISVRRGLVMKFEVATVCFSVLGLHYTFATNFLVNLFDKKLSRRENRSHKLPPALIANPRRRRCTARLARKRSQKWGRECREPAHQNVGSFASNGVSVRGSLSPNIRCLTSIWQKQCLSSRSTHRNARG